MSANTYRNTIARLKSDKARLEQQLSQKRRDLARITSDISRALQSRASNMSALNSKLRQIESKDRELARAQKSVADIESQIARKETEIAQKYQRLDQAERQEQRQKDYEAKRRHDEELRRIRSISQETIWRPRRVFRSRPGDIILRPSRRVPDIPFAKIGREGFRLLVLTYVFDKAGCNSASEACKTAANLIYFIDPEEYIKPGSLQRTILNKLRQRQESGLRVYFKVHDYSRLLQDELEAQKLDSYLPIIEKHWQQWEEAGKPTVETSKVDKVDE